MLLPQQIATPDRRSPHRPRPDRRKCPRSIVSERITLRNALSGPTVPGTLQDFSREGCLVGLQWPANLRVADVVELKLDSDPDELLVLGAVRHTALDGLLAGVEFLRDGARESIEVGTFLSTLRERTACEVGGTCS